MKRLKTLFYTCFVNTVLLQFLKEKNIKLLKVNYIFLIFLFYGQHFSLIWIKSFTARISNYKKKGTV